MKSLDIKESAFETTEHSPFERTTWEKTSFLGKELESENNEKKIENEENIKLASKYDDDEYNKKAAEECLNRGDVNNAKKHIDRL